MSHRLGVPHGRGWLVCLWKGIHVASATAPYSCLWRTSWLTGGNAIRTGACGIHSATSSKHALGHYSYLN